MARACGENAKHPSASAMTKKTRRQGGRPLDFLNCRVVIVLVFIFCISHIFELYEVQSWLAVFISLVYTGKERRSSQLICVTKPKRIGKVEISIQTHAQASAMSLESCCFAPPSYRGIWPRLKRLDDRFRAQSRKRHIFGRVKDQLLPDLWWHLLQLALRTSSLRLTCPAEPTDRRSCSRRLAYHGSRPPAPFRSLLLIPEVALRPHYISPGTKGSWRDDRDSLEYRYTRGRAISRLRATPVESALLLLRASLRLQA